MPSLFLLPLQLGKKIPENTFSEIKLWKQEYKLKWFAYVAFNLTTKRLFRTNNEKHTQYFLDYVSLEKYIWHNYLKRESGCL